MTTMTREPVCRVQRLALTQGEPIAGVSLDFLYSTGEIRRRVEQLRDQQQAASPAPATRAETDQPGSVVRTLTAQLAELKRRHRDEIRALNQALEASHGENLELRRRLGRRPQAQQA